MFYIRTLACDCGAIHCDMTINESLMDKFVRNALFTAFMFLNGGKEVANFCCQGSIEVFVKQVECSMIAQHFKEDPSIIHLPLVA